MDPVLGATPAFVLPSFCPALQGIALCIRSGCALAKNRFAAMGLVDNGCLCGSHSHLPLGWLIWGMHLCCFLMGWGHSSFSIIYAGRGATSDEHFSFFVRKKHSFRGPGFGYQFGSRFGPPGSKTRAVFGTRTWTQKIHGFGVPLLPTPCEGMVMWLRAQPSFRTALV